VWTRRGRVSNTASSDVVMRSEAGEHGSPAPNKDPEIFSSPSLLRGFPPCWVTNPARPDFAPVAQTTSATDAPKITTLTMKLAPERQCGADFP
jgi:hypothetical protein